RIEAGAAAAASKRARMFQSAAAGDAPRGVASRARSKRQLECSEVPRVKPICSHFWLCVANGFEELSPGKQLVSRTADAAAIAMTMVRRPGISGWAPHRANGWHVSQLVFLAGVARTHPVVHAPLPPPNRSECVAAAGALAAKRTAIPVHRYSLHLASL